MADAEPIIIHGTPTGIQITHGTSITSIEPASGETPFGRVIVEIDGSKNEPISTQKNWTITIKSGQQAPQANARSKNKRAKVR